MLRHLFTIGVSLLVVELMAIGSARAAESAAETAPDAEKSLGPPPVRIEKIPEDQAIPTPHTTTPDGKTTLLVTGKTAQLLDIASQKPRGVKFYHPGPFGCGLEITCWSFSPDGKLLVTAAGQGPGGGDDSTTVGQVRIWDVATRKLVYSSHDEFGCVRAVAFDCCGKVIYVRAPGMVIDGR